MQQAVCVSGIGCLCAAGDNLDQAVASMMAGERHVGPAPLFCAQHPKQFPVFAVHSHVPSYSDDIADDVFLRTRRLALCASEQAVEHCGWDLSLLRKLRVGVCIGTTVGSAMDVEPMFAEYRQGKQPDMRAIRCFLKGNPANTIRHHFGFSGPCQTIVNACSSGTDAIGTAAMWLRNGVCDVVLAGGADELCRTTYNGFAALQISSNELCSPFSAERTGLNLGEGAAMLLLTTENVRRKLPAQPVCGYIHGYGSGTDSWHLTAPHPEGRGLKQAINEAFADSGLSGPDLSFINTHGTGTKDNDLVESQVLSELLDGIPFHSTKGYTGHTLGAAGAIEAALTLAFLYKRQIPASAGFTTLDKDLAVVPVTQNTTISGDIALSESLAFGGNNAALILGRGERS